MRFELLSIATGVGATLLVVGAVEIVHAFVRHRLERAEHSILTQLYFLQAGTTLSRFEIVRQSKGTLRRGSVYVHLSALEDRGLVTSREEEAHGIWRRHYYLTAYGRRRAFELLKGTEARG